MHVRAHGSHFITGPGALRHLQDVTFYEWPPINQVSSVHHREARGHPGLRIARGARHHRAGAFPFPGTEWSGRESGVPAARGTSVRPSSNGGRSKGPATGRPKGPQPVSEATDHGPWHSASVRDPEIHSAQTHPVGPRSRPRCLRFPFGKIRASTQVEHGGPFQPRMKTELWAAGMKNTVSLLEVRNIVTASGQLAR